MVSPPVALGMSRVNVDRGESMASIPVGISRIVVGDNGLGDLTIDVGLLMVGITQQQATWFLLSGWLVSNDASLLARE